MLHFDLSQGCSARSLCAALLDLGAPLKSVEAALPQLHVRYMDKSLDFLDASGRSLQSLPPTPVLKRSRFKAKLRWNRSGLPSPDFDQSKSPSPTRGEGKLDPIPGALLQKAERLLTEAGYTPTTQDMCELTAFFVLLTNLDPKAISATRVPLSFAADYPHRDVLLKLSLDIPVFESQWPGPTCDPAGLALMKTCVSHFGPRGESLLLKMGLGFSPEVRALWCEPASIMTRPSASAQPRIAPLVQITAYVPDSNLLGELTHRLNQIGAKHLWSQQVQDQSTHPKTQITVIASEADQNKIIEALLILGQAPDIQMHLVEQHTLQKRTVSVTLGRPQKLQICRVVESLWGDKILRADPLPDDLLSISKATGQPQEIVRADVLTAWKARSF